MGYVFLGLISFCDPLRTQIWHASFSIRSTFHCFGSTGDYTLCPSRFSHSQITCILPMSHHFVYVYLCACDRYCFQSDVNVLFHSKLTRTLFFRCRVTRTYVHHLGVRALSPWPSPCRPSLSLDFSASPKVDE